MNVLEALRRRRTIRTYEKDYQIPKETLETIINAGLDAPTAKNVQEIDLIVITNREKIDQLTDHVFNSWGPDLQGAFGKRREDFGVKNPITGDASCLVLLVKNERADPIFLGIDTGIITMTLLQAAQNFNLDSMCCGCMLWGDVEGLEKVAGIPKGSFMMAVAIGKAIENPFIRPKSRIAKATYIE